MHKPTPDNDPVIRRSYSADAFKLVDLLSFFLIQ